MMIAFFVEFSCFPQIYKTQGYPAWVTITAAVVLSVTGRRVTLPYKGGDHDDRY